MYKIAKKGIIRLTKADQFEIITGHEENVVAEFDYEMVHVNLDTFRDYLAKMVVYNTSMKDKVGNLFFTRSDFVLTND